MALMLYTIYHIIPILSDARDSHIFGSKVQNWRDLKAMWRNIVYWKFSIILNQIKREQEKLNMALSMLISIR